MSPLHRSWSESVYAGCILMMSENDDHYQQIISGPSPIASLQLLEIMRIQLPQSLIFLSRYMFYIKINSPRCCKPNVTNSIIWISLSSLDSQVKKAWGPELMQYGRWIVAKFERFTQQVYEFSLNDLYFYSPRDPPRNAEETLLLELDISEKTIEVLYNDFLDHCLPCFSLPVESFKFYLSKFGLQDDDRLDSLFLAFNYLNSGYISFHELLMGLAALEPNACHSDTRIKFIFRFYDSGCKGFLNYQDFRRMMVDVFPSIKPVEFEDILKQCLHAVDVDLTYKQSVRITFKQFNNAIRTHKIRGTSQLCRSVAPVFLQLTKRIIRRKKRSSDDLGKEWNDLKAVVIPRTHKGN